MRWLMSLLRAPDPSNQSRTDDTGKLNPRRPFFFSDNDTFFPTISIFDFSGNLLFSTVPCFRRHRFDFDTRYRFFFFYGSFFPKITAFSANTIFDMTGFFFSVEHPGLFTLRPCSPSLPPPRTPAPSVCLPFQRCILETFGTKLEDGGGGSNDADLRRGTGR